MLCSQCNINEANVHFSGLVNGRLITSELCETCAETLSLAAPFINPLAGGFSPGPFSFASPAQPALNDIIDLLSDWHGKTESVAVNKSKCPVCKWTLAQFQKAGKMGCASCYAHFQAEASNLLMKIHGDIGHKGKKAPAEVAQTKIKEKTLRLTRLKANLEKAVREEKYELAAQIRDEIKEFERKQK